MSNRPPLTIDEAAEQLAVSGKTIRRMLGENLLEEVERDARGRILISADSVDAAAVRMHRKKVAREEVREIAPALNANAEASLAAVQAFRYRATIPAR